MTGTGRAQRPRSPDAFPGQTRAPRPGGSNRPAAVAPRSRGDAMGPRVCGLDPRAGAGASGRCRDIVPELILELI